jgi:hypothetical protein
VPDGPSEVLLCRYSGLGVNPPSSPRAFRLVDDLFVVNRSTVTTLAGALDRLPVLGGTFSCPADFADAVVAEFRYRSGPADPVRVGLSGCDLVSNGHVHRAALFSSGQSLVKQLVAMTSGTGVGISKHARTGLLKLMLRTASGAGDAHPYDIEAVKTTYLEAELLMGPDRSPDVPAYAPVYLVAERGNFTAYNAPRPPGAPPPRGTVNAAIFTASLRVTDGFLGNRYPRMRDAGRVVRLGR